MLRPFQQMAFSELPEEPRVPHDFHATEGRDIHVKTDALGPLNVHVRVFGNGPPLLLVHGLMTSSYSWRYVFRALGEHYTCYAPDLPGAGRSDRSDGAYSPTALAELLGAIQSALDIRGCAVIGNSMGGYVAMVWALADPGAMSRLVNLHSPGVPELRLHALRAGLAIPGVQPTLRWVIRRDPIRWAFKNVHYFDESLKSLEEAREYGEVLRGDGADTLVKYLAETMAPGPIAKLQAALTALRDAGKDFPVPMLLLYGRRDPMVPPRFGTVFADRIPSAHFEWLEDASHFAHVDAVDRFLPPTLRFLNAEG